MDGRRATGWWGTEAQRSSRHPNVRWERNIRYVADGRVVSSAGISASLPAEPAGPRDLEYASLSESTAR